MKTVINKNYFGPWALITGASSGIGEEFARQLAANGINLVLAARRKNILDELGEKLKRTYGIKYQSVQTDLSQESSLNYLLNAIEGIDIGLFISNAGAAQAGRFADKDFQNLLKNVQLNALSHLRLAHHFSQVFKYKKRGGIILVGAMGASEGVPYMATEAGGKALIESLGKSLNEELTGTGVHVTVLVTSPTDTQVIDYLGFREGEMPSKPVPVKQCVDETLAAFLKNQTSIIPGKMYRIMHSVIPEGYSRKMMGSIIKKNNNII